jgi:hypothetical protein
MPDPATAPATPNLPGVSRLILIASEQFPRYSEGDVIELKDGRLFLAVARKRGASDFAAGEIIGMFSSDGGVTWDDQPYLIKAPFSGLVDLMSVSFCHSPRGLHLFFLGRGKDAKGDTQPYQMLSTDEGKTWGEPKRISLRGGYYVVNNARVIRTSKGRMFVPAAYVERIDKDYEGQSILVLYSDDDGATWAESNVISFDKALMEPGVAECADGSIYMTIRTAQGLLYEARSRDGGAKWADFGPTKLPAPAAPSTVVRAPGSDDLWMFWCNNARAKWKDRSPQVFALSRDHGRTWSEPRVIEHDPKHSYGYISFTPVKNQALLTYYDWPDNGQVGFHMTSLRQRTIPLAWLRGEVAPPVFRKQREPVLKQDQDWEGKTISMNSGLLAEKDHWRLWYTTGQLGPTGESLKVCYAESRDAGLTWTKRGVVPLAAATAASPYHASAHRDRNSIVLYAWLRDGDRANGLYRFVSNDDGRSFAEDPAQPLIVSHNASADQKAQAGPGRISNDAFDVVRNPHGSYEYFAACVTKATDLRAVIEHDNARGLVRQIGRATSRDGVAWSPLDIVISPAYDEGDAFDMQFYGMQLVRHRRFYLGLLFVFHVQSQSIQPEWAWSHNGDNWTRTHTPCVALGDEGSFDSRMILFGDVVATEDELIWLYSGYDWRHNAFKQGEVNSCIGRASLPLSELDAWLDSLPQP